MTETRGLDGDIPCLLKIAESFHYPLPSLSCCRSGGIGINRKKLPATLARSEESGEKTLTLRRVARDHTILGMMKRDLERAVEGTGGL